jgi:aspartyl-tRNA(Asn)/glutamyl-tRNA(Gln) amidotransferase subunit A
MTDEIHSRRTFLAASLGAAAALSLTPLRPRAQEVKTDLKDAASDLADLTLKEASDRLASGAVSSVELTEACLARIDTYNPLLNAYITVARDEALSTARQMDAELKRGVRRGPLHGVPIALKDNLDTAGIRTTGASELFEHRVPAEDAEAARRLKEAGTVLLGKLNLHEFAYGGSATVTYFGTMHNPWNLAYETGGSSGGPGAAVAARLCYGALGTDTAGSVRMPASHCGIVGLKPTFGRVSTRGVMILSWTLDHVGPMCRSVEDAALMLNTIAGYDDREPTAANRPVPDYTAALRRPTAGLRIGLPRKPFFDGLFPEQEQAIEAALKVIRGLTASMTDVSLPTWGNPAVLWGVDAYVYHRQWITASPEKYQPSTRRSIQHGAEILGWQYSDARRHVDLLRQSIGQVFNDVDLLVLPTMKGPAGLLSENSAARGNNDVAFDVFGLPAISVPCGFTANGLPLGIQIVGRHFDELTVFALAHAYEQATRWHLRRPPLESYLEAKPA